MTTAEESQQITAKLSHIRGADVVLQVKIVNSLAEKDPEIFFVEDGKLFSRANQQVIAVVVKCGGMNLLAEKRADALAHLASGGHGVGEGEHFVGPGVALLNETGDAVDQDRGFAGAGAGHDEHRPANMLNGFALAIVGEEGIRFWFGDSHWGSEYHRRRGRASVAKASHNQERFITAPKAQRHPKRAVRGTQDKLFSALSKRGQSGSDNRGGGDGGGLGAEDGVAQRGGDPSRLLE